MKDQSPQKSAPSPYSLGPESSDSAQQTRGPDPQETLGNAAVAAMVAAENQVRGGGSGSSRASADPTRVSLLGSGAHRDGIESFMQVHPSSSDGASRYVGQQLHEHFGPPQAIGLSDADLTPGHTLSNLFHYGSTSGSFTVEEGDGFSDYHVGGGVRDPAAITEAAWARGFSWEGEQHYTHAGRRLAGTFTVRRDLAIRGGNPSINITKR